MCIYHDEFGSRFLLRSLACVWRLVLLCCLSFCVHRISVLPFILFSDLLCWRVAISVFVNAFQALAPYRDAELTWIAASLGHSEVLSILLESGAPCSKIKVLPTILFVFSSACIYHRIECQPCKLPDIIIVPNALPFSILRFDKL